MCINAEIDITPREWSDEATLMAEAGEDQRPKRCHCGFWGSPQTMNMCSKCYKEYQQQMSQVAGHNTSASDQMLNFIPGYGKESLLSVGSGEEKKDECPEQKSECKEEKMEVTPTEAPVQKSKKKCWKCSAKLPLSQQQLGECKCGFVFCSLHRLPEQHDCQYDHKEVGRQEALKTMVPAGKKKMGRSFHRMDSRPE